MAEAVQEIMDVHKFLAVYGVSRSTLNNEMKKGNIKITRSGKRIYIKRKDADEWLSKFGDD